MADYGLGNTGTLGVVPPAVLEAQLERQKNVQALNAQASQPRGPNDYNMEQLAGYIRREFEIYRNHRNSQSGWNERLMVAMRTMNGQYDSSKLAEIKRFGGSQSFILLTAQKCRGASSLLRDIYLGPDRPWALRAPASPNVPDDILQKIDVVIQGEGQAIQQQTGQPAPPADLLDKKRKLIEAAEEVAKKRAEEQTDEAEDKIEDILRVGHFYVALAEFLVDLPVFPFGVLKGPVVKVFPEVTWPKAQPGQPAGAPTVERKPRLYWYRVSPFDFWFTPGVSDIENANTIERHRITRADINDMLDLPGYNQENLYTILEQYGRGGLYDNWDTTDSERAVLESRENPAWNRSALINMMEFNGNVQGAMLKEYGLEVDDELRDYHVQVWVIGSYVIKAQLSPSPRTRHPYFITSFEKVPGTPVGNGLTDILSDIQDNANSTIRALVNNMSMASGPQVVVNDDRLSADENGEEIFPWKRWHVRSDPISTNSAANKPIEFFQPQSHAQEMFAVFKEWSALADDISAIPKYIEGGNAGSGAGRTASGLAMLMGNASKILQTVSANVDRDVLEQALLQLFDLILLTDPTGTLTGDEQVTVLGVNVVIQKETMRQRQVEFLTATNNPTDLKIMGITGRASVLRPVAKNLGLEGDEIVPTDEKIKQMQEQEEQAQQNAPVQQAVDKAVQDGVAAGVKRITTELTSGILASVEHMPLGNPTHVGTPGGEMQQGAAQAQGGQPPPPSQGAPQTNTVSNAAPQGPAPGGA